MINNTSFLHHNNAVWLFINNPRNLYLNEMNSWSLNHIVMFDYLFMYAFKRNNNDVMRESMTSQQLITSCQCVCVCVEEVCVCVCVCVCVFGEGMGKCVCTVCATSILTTAFLYKRRLHKVINSFLIISIAKIHVFIIIYFV